MELTIDDALKQGIEAHRSGQLQEADRLYTAILQVNPKQYEPPPEDDVPLFYSFEYKQERQRFSSLPTVANTFKRRTDPLKGINFTELVNSLGEPEILNLERGKRFI